MSHRMLLVILVLSLTCKFVGAENVTKTLSSPNGDKISITYNISQKNEKVTIQFTDVRHTLGDLHRKKYKNDDNVVTLFFSRNGSFNESGTKFQGKSTKAFVSPAGLTYNRPVEDDGFYIASKKPMLAFDSKATEAVTLSIPFYLATHPRKGVYDIIENCGILDIPIVPKTDSPNSTKKGSQQKTVEYTIEEEESSFTSEDDARIRIAHINQWLDLEGTINDDLKREIVALAALKDKIKDKSVLRAINEILEKYVTKKEELEQQVKQQEADKAKAQKDAEERELYLRCTDTINCLNYLEVYGDKGIYSAQVNDKLENLRADKKRNDDKQQKRTIWMIIGGALLAVLLFVGNQVMQSFRNIKTQRSIMQMQQNATRQATGNAKRRVAGIIHNKTHQAMNVTRNKGKTLVQKGVEKTKNASLKKGGTKAKTIGKKTNSNKQVSI